MNRSRRYAFPLLIAFFVLTALACQAATNLPATLNATPTEFDQDALLEDAVATVEANLQTSSTGVPLQTSALPTPIANLADLDLGLEDALINVYARVNPSVVHIFVFDSVESATVPLGTGSGFVYDDAGYIITNNHVVADGNRFEVVFADGSRRAAELVGADIDSDLAVIRVTELPEGVAAVSLSDSNDLRVGQFVIAIGNPFGEAGSMSIGIVSGLGRTIESQRIAEGGGRYSLPEVIQTDAAINPGNSGGPLLNLLGEVIGVNSAILTRTGTNSGVGFSIPVNAVKRVIPALVENGSYTYPYIGVRMLSLSLDLQEELNLDQTGGAYLTEITPGSPAEEAGLVGIPGPGGDLIIAIDDVPVMSSDDLISYLVFETEVGQTVMLTVLRDGESIQVPLTLGARP